MRIPAAIAIQGGEHDCRNRTLHKMFRLVGVGEQADSGLPKIYRGWASQRWRPPALYERVEPYNQTRLELRMVDMLPEEVVIALREVFGAKLDALDQNARLTLAVAYSERVVIRARVRELTALHSFDTTRMLQRLVQEGFLEAHNPGRGAVYSLPGAAWPTPEDVFGGSSAHFSGSSTHLEGSSTHLDDIPTSANPRDSGGRLLADQLDAPVIDSLEMLSPNLREQLLTLSAPARTKGRLPVETMKEIVFALCAGHYVTLSCLTRLLERDQNAFRQQHLKPLVKDGRLRLAFPTTPTHAKQAYRSVN
jgi:hypothetical protein